MSLDPGHRAIIQSMSGVKSRFGHGLRAVELDQPTVTAAIPVTLIAAANPLRVYVMLQNHHATNSMFIYMGNEFIGTLFAGDTIVWDKDHPWTGPIYAMGGDGDSTARGVEVSLAAEQAV